MTGGGCGRGYFRPSLQRQSVRTGQRSTIRIALLSRPSTPQLAPMIVSEFPGVAMRAGVGDALTRCRNTTKITPDLPID